MLIHETFMRGCRARFAVFFGTCALIGIMVARALGFRAGHDLGDWEDGSHDY